MRLLAKKSPHFFTYGNNPIARLPDYLDNMLKKMSGFNPSASATSNGTSGWLIFSQSFSPSSCLCFAETKEAGKESKPDIVTVEQMEKLAANLGDKWKKFIPKLAFSKEDQAKFETEGKSDKEAAVLMFKKWAEAEGDGAVKDELVYVVESLKMGDMLKGVFE